MYDTLIMANGEIPCHLFWQNITYSHLICTDGAFNTLKKLDITPEVVIGDMDSLTASSIFPATKFLPIEDQNTTDFEKALKFSALHFPGKVLCLGIFGKAADHSVHNLALIHQYSQSLQLSALHMFNEEQQWIFSLPPKIKIVTPPGAIISFFPLTATILTTQGLKWELIDMPLSPLKSMAVRNYTLKAEITVQCQGACLCFITTSTPPCREIMD